MKEARKPIGKRILTFALASFALLAAELNGQTQANRPIDFDAMYESLGGEIVFRGILKDEFGPFKPDAAAIEAYHLTDAPIACGIVKNMEQNYFMTLPFGNPTSFATEQAMQALFAAAESPRQSQKQVIFESGPGTPSQSILLDWHDETSARATIVHRFNLDQVQGYVVAMVVMIDFKNGKPFRFEQRYYPNTNNIPSRFRVWGSQRETTLKLDKKTKLPYFLTFICENDSIS